MSVRHVPAQPDTAAPVPGASPDEVFLVSASEPREYRLRFEQRRPWEAAAAPRTGAQTLVLRVH